MKETVGRAGQPLPADCTVTCSLEVLMDLASGRVKPASAFIKGLVRVSGERHLFVLLRGPVRDAVEAFKAAAAARTSTTAPVVRASIVDVSVSAPAGEEPFALYTLRVSEDGGG